MAFSPAASVPAPAQSTPFPARRTMDDPVVFSTGRQSPPPEPLQRLFVPIISIDHLSQDYQDLPVDDILALGDQGLLYQFEQAFFRVSQNWTTPDQSRMSAGRLQERNSAEQDPMPAATPQIQSQPARTLRRPTSAQSVRNSDDELVPPAGWFPSNPAQQSCQLGQDRLHENLLKNLLSMSIDEEGVFGPLVNRLYTTLNSLKTRGPCEVLLYLSGHGIDPGNTCLVPSAMRPHPTRSEHDLRKIDPDKWYKYKYSLEKDAERYLKHLYCNHAEAFGDYSRPSGFVGGEVYAHHRGFIGVLGVLGLWCHAHCECEGDTYHHLVIVADCCFAGIWGATLEHIMKSRAPCLEEYRKLLLKYPVSIQCATDEFEASHGGLFTPLWYFLQTEQQLRNYCDAFNESEHVSDDEMATQQASPKIEPAVTQHPWYVSTSKWRPTCKCYDDPAFFLYLQTEQLKALELDLRNEENLAALHRACIPQTPEPVEITDCDVERGFKHLKHFSQIVQPLITAFIAVAFNLRGLLYKTERRLSCPGRYQDGYREQIERDKQDKRILKHSLAALRDILCETVDLYLSLMPRSQDLPCHNFLNRNSDNLTDAHRQKLIEKVKPGDRDYDVCPGVYVFQGGKGDMSLIVTPGYEQVILIDGTSNAECFIAAWNSILRYLPQISHIFVTHHDEDHTYGIQLLLARYCVGQADIPDISSTTIYMNTRAALRRRNFKHEREIETLANRLHLMIESLIITDAPRTLTEGRNFILWAILPKEALVHEVQRAYDRDHRTGSVSSRGGTTAANVLSINVVAVWKNRDAYLFTGDAHLKDVTQAAQDFLDNHDDIDFFKYVDVPHHRSASSNVKKVDQRDCGLAGIPALNYLISHCGNHQNPSLTTVTHILKNKCQKLHFLYPLRKQPVSCRSCKECGTQNWYCKCVSEFWKKTDTELHDNGPFKFFLFD